MQRQVSHPPDPLRVGTFELDVRSRELRHGSTRIGLQQQPFEILRLMLERPGDVVTRDELQRRLWPEGAFIDVEHSLNAAVKRLRAALGDDADQPKFVETVPRRGYRFIAAAQDAGVAAQTTGAVAPRLRLVVLPFSNLSNDSSREYFSNGLTEELITQLEPLCRGKVGIIAYRSSMFDKGSLQRVREIGEALHADHLFEGSARHEGSRVRITARLVEAATEAHLWSETYERAVSDWLSVQADVAGRVARQVREWLERHVRPQVGTARSDCRRDLRVGSAYRRDRFPARSETADPRGSSWRSLPVNRRPAEQGGSIRPAPAADRPASDGLQNFPGR
jgi:TolB-like protein